MLLLPSLCVYSQSEQLTKMSEHSLMFGGGPANMLDTYISPYSYTVWGLRLQFDTHRKLKMMNGTVSRYSLFDLNGAFLKNHNKNVNSYGIGIRYSMAWLKSINTKSEAFTFSFGPQISGFFGGLAVFRSGNNPANPQANIAIDATAHADYSFNVKNRKWKVKGQLTVPLIGAAFSLNYGQSHYEMFILGHYDRNVVFAHPFNMPSLRYRFTLDIPVGRHESTFRIGYAGQMNQSKFNNLKFHSYTHDFMIGYSKSIYKK